MNDCKINDDQFAESAMVDEISDEDLEVVGMPVGALPTLHGTYCFTCPPVARDTTKEAMPSASRTSARYE